MIREQERYRFGALRQARQDIERTRPGIGRHYPIAVAVALPQVALDGPQHIGVIIDGKHYWSRHCPLARSTCWISAGRRNFISSPYQIRGITNDGIVKLANENLKHWCNEKQSISLLRLSFPSPEHQLCSLGIPSLLPQLPICRGSPRRPRNHRIL